MTGRSEPKSVADATAPVAILAPAGTIANFANEGPDIS
ncbi:hypothetical protein JSE7799_00999 [Jannaschia seosinensis]|uniref:Uncharacterized protein n=1 Tax=Jannaschia seosinensis TaxID=313367 RepID=A0A0M7B908_9RHOB|nr:hypothetical protein JSE7799_00999 [Jannaschia seosinensis]